MVLRVSGARTCHREQLVSTPKSTTLTILHTTLRFDEFDHLYACEHNCKRTRHYEKFVQLLQRTRKAVISGRRMRSAMSASVYACAHSRRSCSSSCAKSAKSSLRNAYFILTIDEFHYFEFVSAQCSSSERSIRVLVSDYTRTYTPDETLEYSLSYYSPCP